MSDPNYGYGYGATSTAQTDDKTMPIVVYALFLGGYLTCGLSPIAGLIMAYVARGGASPMGATHHEFQIRTFWFSICGGLLSVVLGIAGGVMASQPMTAVAGGGLIVLSGLVMLLQTVWFIVRCIVGLVKAAQDQPYAAPGTLLV